MIPYIFVLLNDIQFGIMVKKTKLDDAKADRSKSVADVFRESIYFFLFALRFSILNKNSIIHNVIGNRRPIRMPT